MKKLFDPKMFDKNIFDAQPFVRYHAVLKETGRGTRVFVEEKSPTETVAIVPGWINPENAFFSDDLYTVPNSPSSVQEYSGFGLALPDNLRIEKVIALCEFKEDPIRVGIYDGSQWFSQVQRPLDETVIEYDFSDSTIWTSEKVNSIKLRIQWQVLYGMIPYVDWVAVKILYTTKQLLEGELKEK